MMSDDHVVEVMGPVALARLLNTVAGYMARNPDVARVVPFDVVPRDDVSMLQPVSYSEVDSSRLQQYVERRSAQYAFQSSLAATVNGMGASGMESRPQRWHIRVPRCAPLRPGYCYLGLLNARNRPQAEQELGAWPTFRRLLSLPATYFRKRNDLLDSVLTPVSVVASLSDPCYSFLDTMLDIIRDPEFVAVDGSIAHRYLTNRREIDGVFPCADHVVGGYGRVPRKPRGRMRGGRIVPISFPYHFPLAQVTAESVFVKTLQSMSVPATEYHSEQVLNAMVPYLLETSRHVPWSTLSFVCFGREYSFAHLVKALDDEVGKGNAVRLWVRSFRNGLLCHKAVQYLSDPANWMVKQYMAYKYNCTDEQAIYAFDCNSVLKHIYPATYKFRNYLRMSKWLRFGGFR